MKTVLFIYFDNALEQIKCDSYIVSKAKKCIEWRMSIYSEEIERGKISSLKIEIVDSISVTSMTKM